MKRIKPIPGSIPLFQPESGWKPPSLSELPSWEGCSEISLDTEFKDIHLKKLGIGARRGAKIAGYSFMLRGHRPFYVPIRHPDSQNCDEQQSLAYLRDNLKRHKGKLLGANLSGDLDILETTENIAPNYDNCQVQDIQIRGPLIDENRHKYSLEAEASVWGFQGKNKDKLKEAAQSFGWNIKQSGWEACIPDLPSKYVGEYGEHDVQILFPIYDAQQVVIDQQGLNEVINLEANLIPVCLRMRQRGVRIDFTQLDLIEKWATEEEVKTLAEIKVLTNWDIGFGNCMAAARVAPALLDIGIKLPKTDSGQWSVTTQILSTIEHPVAKLIRYCRQVNKIRTTFVASIRRYQTNGRIHTTFRQVVGVSEKNEKTGAAFGRMSSCNPNLQQQPSRGAMAKMWRKIYLPDEGKYWFSSDLSSQEPRWAVFFSEKLKLKGAKEMADQYRSNPRIDPHAATAEVCGLERDPAKTVLLAQLYGEGPAKLCHNQLKLPTRFMVQTDDRQRHYFETRSEALEFRHSVQGKCQLREVAGVEAQQILDRFNAGVPFFKELSRKVIEKADSVGILKLLGGRHIHFPMSRDGTYDNTYKALNRLIQGSSAMQIKLALLEVEKQFPGVVQLQVHDELLGSVPDKQTAKAIARVMETVFICPIPFRSEVDFGKSWGEMKTICNIPNCLNYSVEWDKPKNFGCEEHALKNAS
jgi:DNA polymerase I-like protein with 3'-5' exonuclease and polymerase domains